MIVFCKVQVSQIVNEKQAIKILHQKNFMLKSVLRFHGKPHMNGASPQTL